jgi:hypothetical protein
MRRTWRRAAVTVLSVFSVAAMAACGGGHSGAPSSLSLSGEKIPVSGVESGLASLCAVAHQANNPTVASATYFATPYTSLHQLAAALAGTRRTALLSGMVAFEKAAIAGSASTTVQTANSLLSTVDGDLTSLKLSAVKCTAANSG